MSINLCFELPIGLLSKDDYYVSYRFWGFTNSIPMVDSEMEPVSSAAALLVSLMVGIGRLDPWFPIFKGNSDCFCFAFEFLELLEFCLSIKRHFGSIGYDSLYLTIY